MPDNAVHAQAHRVHRHRVPKRPRALVPSPASCRLYRASKLIGNTCVCRPQRPVRDTARTLVEANLTVFFDINIKQNFPNAQYLHSIVAFSEPEGERDGSLYREMFDSARPRSHG